MNCQYRVVYATQKRKNASLIPIVVSRIPVKLWNIQSDSYKEGIKKSIEKLYNIHHVDEVCDGIIVADIYYGTCCLLGDINPVFEINYRCSKCGGTEYPALPSDIDGLNELLTEFIKKM